jgi:pilus assembly protein CpaB
LVVILALVFGGSVALGINNLRMNMSPGDQVEKVDVVVVKKDKKVAPGETLTEDMLEMRPCAKDVLLAGAFTEIKGVLDRTAKVPLAKEELILEAKLVPPNSGRGIAALIPDGKRACTITTNVSSSVAGFILPGNHVDVLLTVNGGAAEADGGGSTTTLLEDVVILAVENKVDTLPDIRIDPNVRSVTLLVDQSQAAKLALGQNRGTLQLTLRNSKDPTSAKARPATMTDIQYHPQKSWSEQVKGVFDSVGKAIANKRPGELVSNPGPEGPAPAEIRTSRGMQEGVVYVKPPPPVKPQ